MKISEQLENALFESIDEVKDIAKALFRLTVTNLGHWKSEKQARFILRKLDTPTFKDRAAEAFARRKGLDGRAFTHITVSESRSRKKEPKTIYTGAVFVVDNGGVVFYGIVKGDSATDLNWSKVRQKFERTKPPKIIIDIHAEKQANIEKNKAEIDLIKSISGWETKSILVSFLQQLEGGSQLSLKQRAVIQKMAPDKISLGDKAEWKKAFEEFKRLVVPKVYVPMLLNFSRQFAIYKGDNDYRDLALGAGETKDEFYNNQIKYHGQAIDEASKWKFTHSNRPLAKIHKSAVWNLFRLFSRGGKSPASSVHSFKDIAEQVEKVLTAKRPTRKALGVMDFVVRAAEGMRTLSPENISYHIVVTTRDNVNYTSVFPEPN